MVSNSPSLSLSPCSSAAISRLRRSARGRRRRSGRSRRKYSLRARRALSPRAMTSGSARSPIESRLRAMSEDQPLIALWSPSETPSRCTQRMDSGFDVPGDVDEDDALVALQQDEPLQDFGAFVVQGIVIPVALDQLGHDHRDLAAGVFGFDLQNVVTNGKCNQAVG